MAQSITKITPKQQRMDQILYKYLKASDDTIMDAYQCCKGREVKAYNKFALYTKGEANDIMTISKTAALALTLELYHFKN